MSGSNIGTAVLEKGVSHEMSRLFKISEYSSVGMSRSHLRATIREYRWLGIGYTTHSTFTTLSFVLANIKR